MIINERNTFPKIDIHRMSEETGFQINTFYDLQTLIFQMYSTAITQQGPYGILRNCGCDPGYLSWAQQNDAAFVVNHLARCCVPNLSYDIARYRTIFVPGCLPYSSNELYGMANMIIKNYNAASYAAAFAIQQTNEGCIIHLVVITSYLGNCVGIMNESDYLERAVYGWLAYRKKQMTNMRQSLAIEGSIGTIADLDSGYGQP